MARPNLYDLTAENFGQEQSDILGPPYVDTVTQFATNDSTPSVAAGNVFITANSSETEITAFDDGADGQEIEVKVDENTTIIHNDNIKLEDGANFTGVGTSFVSDDNAIIKFRRISGVWVQITPAVITRGAPDTPGFPEGSPSVESPLVLGSPTTVSSPTGDLGGSPSLGLGVGVRHGGDPATAEPAYVSVIGRTPDVSAEYIGPSATSHINSNWGFLTNINSVSGLLGNFATWLAARPTRRMDLAMGLCPWLGARDRTTAGALLPSVAAGDHDFRFISAMQQLKNNYAPLHGETNRPVYIRLGWEMNSSSFPWGTATYVSGSGDTGPNSTKMADFKAAWRHIVPVMRAAISPHNLKFVFCPQDWAYRHSSWGLNNFLEIIYPGDDVVDLIGCDAYDADEGIYSVPPTDSQRQQVWDTRHLPALTVMNEFAVAHGKRQFFGEWGVWHDAGSGTDGGDDNPIYIQECYDWITTHDFEYVVYFNRNVTNFAHHSLTSYTTGSDSRANAKQKFIDTFGQLPNT